MVWFSDVTEEISTEVLCSFADRRSSTGLPNFMQLGWSPTELWCHIDCTTWLP